MQDSFAPFRNALAMYSQTAGLPAQAAQTIAMDKRQQEQNAMANALRQMQMDEMRRNQEKSGKLDNALERLFSRQQVPGTGPVRGVENYQPGAMQTPQPTFADIQAQLAPFGFDGLTAAEKFRPDVQGGFSLSEGQTRFDAQGNPIVSIKKPEKPGKQIERTVDLGDKVEYIYTDGTRESKKKAATPSSIIMGNTKTPKMEMDMRKEFTSLPEVKTHVEISSQVQRLEKAMEENARGGSKVAVDQALITILNKMLDPSSVVRESEYARTPGDLAFLNRMRGKIEKLKTGGAGLTDEDRAAIADMARNFAAVSQAMYDEQANYYGGLAQRYGYNPENVVRLGRFGDKGVQPGGPKTAASYLEKFGGQ